MLHDIIEVKITEEYTLFLRFDDGKCGYVDIAKLIPFKGIFEPLKDPAYFATVSINSDLGTIYWANGADLAPDYLYSQIQ